MKLLRDLLPEGEIVQASGSLDFEVTGIAYDSRRLAPGGAYVAIKGFVRDGIDFLPQAVAAGARAVLTGHPPDPRFSSLVWIQVKNERRALGHLAARFYDDPSQRLNVIGITGTNGKTTTAILTDAILKRVSRSAWIGTLGMEFLGERWHSGLTTPEAPDIFAFLQRVEDGGGRYVTMEVSSASLTLQRVENIRFAQGVFTSFSGEHLDFHQTMENYFQAKLSLFRRLAPGSWAVINADDCMAGSIYRELNCKYLTFGFGPGADVHPEKSLFGLQGIRARLATPRGPIEISSPLVGRFNLANIMAAVCSALAEGVDGEAIAAGIASCQSVRGRAELVHQGDFHVFVDFGHTDDALRHLLKGMREIAGEGRVIVVFGAGGNKDTTKRPRMGAAAAELADVVIVTSDNPRREDPQEIIRQVMAGIPAGRKDVHSQVDREQAIALALELARPGDIVAIAGKGHEEVQIIGERTIPFKDDEVVKRLLGGKHG